MQALEVVIGLFVVAVLLAAAARRVGAPYPVFLALGGAALAFVPGVPAFALPPDLVLALFVAPVLLDAAYDTSLRDLRDNGWPVAALVVVAVGLTTAAVAWVAHALVPGLPWAAAVALGAIVAPPDAVAATAVLRPLRPPHRLLTILEGESLLNDASALLVYRLAVGAALAGSFSGEAVLPAFLLGVLGSVIAGPPLGWLMQRVTRRIEHVPTAIIVQFIGTFGVWLLAERLGLSGVLTTVCFAMTLARIAPAQIPARIRVPTNAVWATVTFALNIFAFIFIGMQIRPVVAQLGAPGHGNDLLVAAAVLATVIGLRIAWHMSFNALVRWRDRTHGFHPPRPMLPASVGSGVVISWTGMRGIVTLASALALPPGFPMRDLVVFVAFSVVLGTLLIQGLTLGPLMRVLRLRDDDPVAQELRLARERAVAAVLAALPGDLSPAMDLVRRDLKARLMFADETLRGVEPASAYADAYGGALRAARAALFGLRDRGDIGDDAFHALENQLDWLELAGPAGPAA